MVKTLPVTGISVDGATFIAQFSNAAPSEIIDHGFVWGTDKVNIDIDQSSGHTIHLGIPSASQFHYTEQSSLGANVTYYVRGFVKTKQHIVYGTMVSFKSLGANGPSIVDFTPKSGKQGDVLTISGTNFGSETKEVTVVFTTEQMEEITVAPTAVSNTSIEIKVPATLYARTSTISVRIADNEAVAAEPFKLDAPEIESISSTNLSACDSLIIQWNSHGFELSNVIVNTLGYPFAVSENKIKLSVKDVMQTMSIRIQSGLFYDSKTYQNNPVPKAVTSSFPASISSGDTLKVRFNFNTTCHSFSASVMGVGLVEAGRTINEIWYVPGQELQNPQQISVLVDNVLLTQSPPIQIVYNGWTRKQDFTGPQRLGAVGFTINGMGYIALGEDAVGLKNDLWEYDPATDQWTQKAQFPGPARLYASAMVVNGKAYVGVGQTHNYGSAFKDFWQYDPTTNTWTQKGDYPGGPRYRGCITFTIGTKGYMGSGQYSLSTQQASDFWEYEPTNDSWTAKATMVDTYFLMSSFSQNSKGYCFWTASGSAARFMYDPVANTWDTNVANPPIGLVNYLPFAFNNEVYFLAENSYSNKVFRVDPVTNQWTFVQYHGGTSFDFRFTIGQKGYTGITSNLLLYEFDPSHL